METVNKLPSEAPMVIEREPSQNRGGTIAAKQKSNEPPSKVDRFRSNRRIVSKVTKLTLKPKPKPKLIATKNPTQATQITTKKYAGIKPVTIKSRSTMISHESTYCIKNIQKKSPTKQRTRQNAENASQQRQSNRITKQPLDQQMKLNQQQQLELNSDNIWHTPKRSQILQEITSAVVNQSMLSVTDSIVHSSTKTSCKFEIEANVSNSDRKLNENSKKSKSKDAIASPQTSKEKGSVSREEIKRRLSALQRNSLKIVEKNVQKAKKCNIVTANKVKIIRKTEEPDSSPKNPKSTPIKSQQKRKSSQTPVTPSKFVPTIKTNKNRIGILRRPEGISPTLDSTVRNQSAFGGIAFAEAAVAAAAIDKTTNSPESLALEVLNISLKVPAIVQSNENLNRSLLSQSKQLRSNENEKGNVDANIDAIDDKNDSIPYWLRPTPVQPYPYNFILAVRKKLESITNPVWRTNGTSTKRKSSPPSVETFSGLLNKVSGWSNQPHAQQQQSIEPISHNNNYNNSSSAMIIQQSVEPASEPTNSINISNQIKTPSKVHLYSINNSNVSNNVSRHMELKSNRMEPINGSGSQDTLSISSGILTSQPSPEKNVSKLNLDKCLKQRHTIMPLAITDAIDGMTMVQRNDNHSNATERHNNCAENQLHISSHINYERGNSFDQRSQLTFDDLNSASITTTSNGSGTSVAERQNNEVHKLLKDFNDSLSQVIKVNQYLHGILSNSPASRRDETTPPTTAKESTKYNSNDFEDAITTERSSIEENIESDKQQTHGRGSERVEQVGGIGYSNSNNQTNLNANSNVRTLVDVSTHESSTPIEVDNGTSDANNDNVPSEMADGEEEGEDDGENGSRSGDSPTNNDLKSISLSIAKKSFATEDETNATESFQKQQYAEPETLNQSIGSDIFIMFNKTSMGLKDELNSSTWSMQSLSYSSLGVCDQLLKSEMRKSEDLASLLKIRERALIDRFKGQIAWLELHKQKFKKAGRIAEISMIKKKQRALLLRLNHDRKELHRIIRERQRQRQQQQQNSHNTSINELNVNYNISHMSTNMSIRRKTMNQPQLNGTSSKRALKALELPGPGGQALEFILQRRENELRRRREHVDKLLNWHQRLDIEEQQVMKLEQMIMFVSSTDAYQQSSSCHDQNYDNSHRLIIVSQDKQSSESHNDAQQFSVKQQLNDLSLDKAHIGHTKQSKQIHKIEKSLNTLKSISARSVSSSNMDGSDTGLNDDVVGILGRQLNKLWRRLTGQCDEQFTPDRVYRLTKSDLESLYERAKSVVLHQFDRNDGFKKRLIDGSMSMIEDELVDEEEPQSNQCFDVEINEKTKTERKYRVEPEPAESMVPALNLTSSSEQSIDPKANLETDQGYYFSNDESVRERCQRETDLDAVEPNEDNAPNATHESEDLQSDITEDSLNQDAGNESASKSSQSSHANSDIRTETIKNDTIDTSTAHEMEKRSPAISMFDLNVSQNDCQLIEDTSFPNIDMQLALPANISSSSLAVLEEISSEINSTQSPDDNNLYESDKFEEVKSTSISTIATVQPSESIETDDLSKIAEQITVESNENSSESVRHATNGQILAPNDESIQTIELSIERSTNEEKIVQENEIDDETIPPSSNVQSDGSGSSSSDNTPEDDEPESAKSESDLSSTERHPQYSLSNEVPEADALKPTLSPAESSDTEPKSAEQSTVFPFLREIPNKPPPPYPAHRQLPKMPAFPSNDRIKEIVYERIAQLYCESKIAPQLYGTPMTATPPPPPPSTTTNNISTNINSNPMSLPLTPGIPVTPVTPGTPNPIDATFVCSPTNLLSPSLTPTTIIPSSNVYERIIVDCCGEIMDDIKNDVNAFRQPLAFYNPPNRLLCYQMYALRRIFKLLSNRPKESHDDYVTNATVVLPSRVARLSSSNRRKRDAVDEILIQELYEDEAKWTNFSLEEEEIRQSVGNDLTKLLVDESSEMHDQSNNTTTTGEENVEL